MFPSVLSFGVFKSFGLLSRLHAFSFLKLSVLSCLLLVWGLGTALLLQLGGDVTASSDRLLFSHSRHRTLLCLSFSSISGEMCYFIFVSRSVPFLLSFLYCYLLLPSHQYDIWGIVFFRMGCRCCCPSSLMRPVSSR